MSLATSTTSQAVRRSTRVRVQLAVLVTSLDPIVPFSQRCETVVVNCHGAALSSPQAIANGTPVLLQLEGNRQAMARVVGCVAAGDKWTIAIKLDRAGNFWNIQPCPEDWMVAGDRPKPASTNVPKPAAPAPPSEPASASKLNAWPLAGPVAGAPAEAAEPPKTAAAPSPSPDSNAQTAPKTEGAAPSAAGDAHDKLKAEKMPVPPRAEPASEPPTGTQAELQQTVKKFRGELRHLMEENLKVIAAQTEALDEKIQGVAKLKGEISVWLKVVPELVQEQISRVREEARTEISQELRSIVADNWEQLERQVAELAAKADKLVQSDNTNEEAVRKQLAEVIREELAGATAAAQDDGAGSGTLREASDTAQLQAQINDMIAQLGNLQGLRTELRELRDSMPAMLDRRGNDFQENLRQAARQETAAALDEFALGRKIASLEAASAESINQLAQEMRGYTESLLQSATKDITNQIDVAVASATAPLREENAALGRKLAEQQTAGEERVGKFQEDFARQIKPLLEQATEQARTQLQAALTEAIAPLRQENSGLAQRIAAVDAAGEERLARIREEVTHYLEPLIQGAAEKARKQFEAALAEAVAPVQHQTAAFGERIADVTEIGRHAAEQVQHIPELIAAQSDGLRRELSEQFAREIQNQIAELKARTEQAATEQKEKSAAAAALLQELAGARDNLNGLLQAAPEKIEAVIRESVAAALASLQGEASNQIQSQLRAQAEELQSGLRRVAEETSARLHQELAVGLQQRLEAAFSEKHAAMEQELERRLEETAKRASVAMESGLQALCATLEQRLSNQSAAQQEQWRTTQAAAAAEISALQSQLAVQAAEIQSQLSRLQLEWGARGEQIIGEILERARSSLQESLEFQQKAQLSQVRTETEQALAPMLSRAASITNDLRSALASVESEHRRSDIQLGALRQEREQLHTWLVQRSGEFHKNVQDALVEATGEVKGRMHLAMELMDEGMRKTGEEAGLRLQGIAEHQAGELAARLKSAQEALAASAAEAELHVKSAQLAQQDIQQQFETRVEAAHATLDKKQHEFESRVCDAHAALQASQQDFENRINAGREELKSTEEEAKRALAASLESQHALALDKFRAAAEQASAEALSRWQSDISEKLRLVQQILGGKTT